jgi:hypothetical protein
MIMEIRPPTPYVAHSLATAPRFVGRTEELRLLRQHLAVIRGGVLALIGLGGSGKTALAAAWLQELLAGPPRFQGLVVWSFYQEPDAGQFLQEAYHYFGGQTAPARGAGLLHLLRQALDGAGPSLLVLDGLERVQQAAGPARTYGQIEDPLLRGLLLRIGEGLGSTTALVTSRFPLTDLQGRENHGYFPFPVGALDQPAAIELLRGRGVAGPDDQLAKLVDCYGAHPLTLEHLGGLIGQFLGGDPGRAPEAPAYADPRTDRQALRLARLLLAYEQHLSAEELGLLTRLAMIRRNLDLEQLQGLFACSPAVSLRGVRELTDADRLAAGFKQNELIKAGDILEAIRTTLEEALVESPLAGPVETFHHEILNVIRNTLTLQNASISTDDLVRIYAGNEHQPPSDRLPLPLNDRVVLQTFHAKWLTLRQLLGFEEQEDPLMTQAFSKVGWKKRPPGEDDLYRAHRLRLRLNHLAIKHGALVRVREWCRAQQQKWQLAGPLARLDAAGLRQVLDTLVARHLVVREADGAFSVHPAVKDHFGRLATTAEAGAWHDALRHHLMTLIQKPGQRWPDDPAALDLIEEAIHHSLSAGRLAEAQELFTDRLGGLRHLAWKLGELARGRRILRAFEPVPDPWALAWFERGLGELEKAYRLCPLPYFRADIRLLQGRLPEVEAEGDEGRTAVARFLMGQTTPGEKTPLPSPGLGCVIPRLRVLTLAGRHQEALRSAGIENSYQEMGWEADRARQLLLLADLACRRLDAATACRHLDQATPWILHSGSIEHLGLYHLIQARVSRLAALVRSGNLLFEQQGTEESVVRHASRHPHVEQDLTEGLHIAQQCGFQLLHIDLLCLRSDLEQFPPEVAETSAHEALERALDAKCGYLWGAAQAGVLLGRALANQKRFAKARSAWEQARSLCWRLADPKTEMIEDLLKQLPG